MTIKEFKTDPIGLNIAITALEKYIENHTNNGYALLCARLAQGFLNDLTEAMEGEIS